MGEEKKNFYLWGSWSQRVVKTPFLTQKVTEDLRDVIIGSTFIIALDKAGKLWSWGESIDYCLGQGSIQSQREPKQLESPQLKHEEVIEIQHGSKHILALTLTGKVFAWGNNEVGQLGTGDHTERQEPCEVQLGSSQSGGGIFVKQIIATGNMSYCLTRDGDVFAWGCNQEGRLGVEHEMKDVAKPQPMMRLKGAGVKRLAVKEVAGEDRAKEFKATGGTAVKDSVAKVIVAFVDWTDPLSQKATQESPGPEEKVERTENVDAKEKEIFEGVDLMRKVMDNTRDWWNHMEQVKHGAPYDDNPMASDDPTKAPEGDYTPQQLDNHVGLDILERAAYELDMLLQSAKAQIQEIMKGRTKGTKNVQFVLAMFMDDCRLRREKIRRTVAARQLQEFKKGMGVDAPPIDRTLPWTSAGAEQSHAQLTKLEDQVQKIRDRLKLLHVPDFFTKAFKEALVECLENRLLAIDLQKEHVKPTGYTFDVKQLHTAVLPALKLIKLRWSALKQCSILELYKNYAVKQGASTSMDNDELLAFLVKSSEGQIDEIIKLTTDATHRDGLVPNLCYDLLQENAELRKMCQTYQLKVYLDKFRPEKQRALAGSP